MHNIFTSLQDVKIFEFYSVGNGYFFNLGGGDMDGDGVGNSYYFNWPNEEEKDYKIIKGCGDSFLDGDYDENENTLIHPYESFNLSFLEEESISVDDCYERHALYLTSWKDEM